MKNTITEKSYELINDEAEENFHIKFKDKPFKGVVIKVHTVSLHVQDDGDTAKLSFDYDVIKCPKSLNQKDLTESSDFTDFTGDVISHIIQSAFDSGNYKIGDNEDDDTASGNNSKKAHKRRAVLP